MYCISTRCSDGSLLGTECSHDEKNLVDLFSCSQVFHLCKKLWCNGPLYWYVYWRDAVPSLSCMYHTQRHRECVILPPRATAGLAHCSTPLLTMEKDGRRKGPTRFQKSTIATAQLIHMLMSPAGGLRVKLLRLTMALVSIVSSFDLGAEGALLCSDGDKPTPIRHNLPDLRELVLTRGFGVLRYLTFALSFI